MLIGEGKERRRQLSRACEGSGGERLEWKGSEMRAREKGEAQKSVEELKQQVSAKGAELEKERKEKQLEQSV